MLTAAAFDELARRGVEVAVIEAGLGGRFDATNVLGAEVVVLTNVGLEHTRWLGPTIADIAGEKLAVVREGATLVLGDEHPDVLAIAERTGARIVRPASVGIDAPGYQRMNLGAAVAAAKAVLGVALDTAPISLLVPGRLQVVGHDPLTIYDGAHNAPGIAALAQSVPAGHRRGAVRARRQGRRRDVARAPSAALRRRFHARAEPACALAGDARGPRAEGRRDDSDRDRARSAEGRQKGAGDCWRTWNRARHGLHLPRRRPAQRSGGAPGECAVNEGGPSVIAMIALVAVVVAVVILIFFGIGYALGRAFL